MNNPFGQPIQSQPIQSQPQSSTMSYEEFQEQVRQRQQQEQIMARQALQQAGADKQSERIRMVIQDLQGIQSELARAENQLQVQMDAQRRQIGLISQEIARMEQTMRSELGKPSGMQH